MSRQHAAPVLVPADGPAAALQPLGLGQDGHGWSEADVQALVQAHPACLPIAEVDPLFARPVPICTELNTTAGPIDNFLVTASGLPVLVECKLWRNPQARREVVGQILDYAKELSRWTSSDLQREASRRLQREGNVLLDLVREAGHQVDEIAFNDALTTNLRRGRFLLLIVGDGIREGVEAIAEYLQAHAGLHFTLGLVEMPIFTMPDGARLVVPRVLARTVSITREVVALPDGFTLQNDGSSELVTQATQPDGPGDGRLTFINELVAGFVFSDPDQPSPKPTPKGYLFLYMPAPKSSCWINISVEQDSVGLWLTSNKNSVGDRAVQRLAENWPELRDELGGAPELRTWGKDASRFWIAEWLPRSPYATVDQRREAIEWLRSRMDTWVSILRPRVRAIVADIYPEQL